MKFFKVGDIITGTEASDRHYNTTNSNAVMLVTGSYQDYLEVMVLYAKNISSLGHKTDVQAVCYGEKLFEHTTFEEFEAKGKRYYKFTTDKMQKVLSKYQTKQREKYQLSDSMRTELLNETKTLLTKYHYNPTDDGLNKIIDEWCANKGDLIRMFEKHPNYNGKFQIAFDCDFDRQLDRIAINRFVNWLNNRQVKERILKKIKIGVFEYGELCEICRRLNNYTEVFYYNPTVNTINGNTHDYYEKEYDRFKKYKNKYENNDLVYCTNGKAYDKEQWRMVYKLDYLLDCLDRTQYLDQFVNDSLKEKLNHYFPEAKIRKGQKTSRAINKILCMMGFDKHPDYNKEFAKFADAVNPLKIKRHTVISIHPVDYLTMSFGNSWSSCHTIDKKNDRGIENANSHGGCYSAGTLSYMLDESSCVFYTVGAEYDGNELELQSKINRCMFHYNDNQLVQGRVYPQSNDEGATGLYKDIREIAQKVFADMLEVPNYWTNNSGVDECSKVIASTGVHYKDYYNFDNCNVSVLKDNRDEHEIIHVGHFGICPSCGGEHSRNRNIECYDCNDRE